MAYIFSEEVLPRGVGGGGGGIEFAEAVFDSEYLNFLGILSSVGPGDGRSDGEYACVDADGRSDGEYACVDADGRSDWEYACVDADGRSDGEYACVGGESSPSCSDGKAVGLGGGRGCVCRCCSSFAIFDCMSRAVREAGDMAELRGGMAELRGVGGSVSKYARSFANIDSISGALIEGASGALIEGAPDSVESWIIR